jgi:hypothetical protein
MADTNRRSGIVFVKKSGRLIEAKGNWTYNLGQPKREAIVGANGETIGYKETGQVPYIEGEIVDNRDLDVVALLNTKGDTVTLELANGKVISLYEAWWAADGVIGTEEANIQARFEGLRAEEIR